MARSLFSMTIPRSQRSCLSDKAILEHMKAGNLIIEPFKRENLATSSYDVTLGEYFFRQEEPVGKATILNPYDEQCVRRIWSTPEKAHSLQWELEDRELDRKDVGKGIRLEDRVIFIKPHETILGHTEEYIGGAKEITTMMKARSSLGRIGIEVCKCAGWGDVGYTNRWTMEITNNSPHYTIPLVVGRRVAQIIFFPTGPILKQDYTKSGKYQSGTTLAQLQQDWKPDAMIPKMWKDREVTNIYEKDK